MGLLFLTLVVMISIFIHMLAIQLVPAILDGSLREGREVVSQLRESMPMAPQLVILWTLLLLLQPNSKTLSSLTMDDQLLSGSVVTQTIKQPTFTTHSSQLLPDQTVPNVMVQVQLTAQAIKESGCWQLDQMDKNYLTSSDMAMMLSVKQKQLMGKCLSTTLNSITLDKTIQPYHNAQIMLFSVLIQVPPISLDLTICLIQIVRTVNWRPMLISLLLPKVILVGSVVVEPSYVQGWTITWFMITLVHSSPQKEFYYQITVGLVTILQAARKYHP